jgi:hypothetical protein
MYTHAHTHISYIHTSTKDADVGGSDWRVWEDWVWGGWIGIGGCGRIGIVVARADRQFLPGVLHISTVLETQRLVLLL